MEDLLVGDGYSDETITISEIDSSDDRSDDGPSDYSILDDAPADGNAFPSNAIDFYQLYFHSLNEAFSWLVSRRKLTRESICFRCNRPGMKLTKFV